MDTLWTGVFPKNSEDRNVLVSDMDSWIERTPDKLITVNDFYEGKIVYGWRRDDKYLYIGMSNKGSSRPFTNHHVIGKKDKWLDRDIIAIWYTLNPWGLEKLLIEKYNPVYNGKPVKRICKRCNKQFWSKVTVACEPCLDYYRRNATLDSKMQYTKSLEKLKRDKGFRKYLSGEQ